MKKNLKGILFLFAALLLLQIGCGGASSSKGMVEEAAPMDTVPMEEAYYEEPAAAEDNIMTNSSSAQSSSGDMAAKTQRKLIRRVELTVETENYDQLLSGLEEEIIRIGGYIEAKDAYHGNLYSRYEGRNNRYANLTVRIPAQKLDEFTGKVGEIGNIINESESVEDVTLRYVDLSSHKKMLQTQQERLLELLKTAETMEDIITIEGRLSEVRYEIESMESQLRTFDNLVDYSTVTIGIQEVERYTPQPEESIKDRILQGLSENTYQVATGIVNFFVEFIIALPVILVWVIVGALFFFIIRGIKRIRKKEKKEEKKDHFFLGKIKSKEGEKEHGNKG